MKKTGFAAKLVAGVAVAAALAFTSMSATSPSASKDFGWFSVHSGQTVSAGHVVQSNADFGWF